MYIWSKMLPSSQDVLFKMTCPQKLFDYDCMTLYYIDRRRIVFFTCQNLKISKKEALTVPVSSASNIPDGDNSLVLS